MTPYVFIGLYDNPKKRFFASLYSTKEQKAILIKKSVCIFLKQDVVIVEGQLRKREFVLARQIGMYFIKKRTNLPLKKIGALYSNRDHSTVIVSIDTIESLCETDRGFKIKVDQIEDYLNNLYIKTKA